ncbi:MAG: FAD-dependent oxidoreductase [Hyphomicrobiaceae bacterium]
MHGKMASKDVIVVGAGPVGLVAAALLAKAGVAVTVVEAQRDVADDLRGSTFHPPTLEHLDRLGVTDELIRQGLVSPQWQYRDRKTGVVATFDLAVLASETRHPYRVQCEQWKLTRMLRDRMESEGSATFIYGAQATGVAQTADEAVLTINREDGRSDTLAGAYVIGADGARSAIRKSLNVAFDGITIPELYLTLSTTFDFDKQVPDLAHVAYVSDPDEWFVLLRTPTMWRVLFPTDASLTDDQMLAPAVVEARLQAVAAHADRYEIVHKTAYRVFERVADRYVVGRVMLAGDAAHLNNPLGGMGMNGGIHDAVNLADKLVEVLNGADPALLGRYERQRRKVALETVQAQALRNRQIMNERDPAKRDAYHAELRATASDPDRARAYLLRSSMIQSLRDLEQVA